MRAALLLCLASCSLPLAPQGYATAPAAAQYASAVRITSTCDGLAGHGSGVAITSRHVITAAHVVACTGEALITATTRDGRTWVMARDLAVAGTDVVRLVVDGTRQPFRYWAEVTHRHPPTGEVVCIVASSEGHPPVRRCGDAGGLVEGRLLVAVPGLRGNSGGGVYDSDGRVVGVIQQGRADYAVAIPISAWRSLVVREVPDLMGAW
jgi:S1-C subfamily serine protease